MTHCLELLRGRPEKSADPRKAHRPTLPGSSTTIKAMGVLLEVMNRSASGEWAPLKVPT
jgi:hypothetical protein